MRLLALTFVLGWYFTARHLHRRGATSKWQVRCLNCQDTKPATDANILRAAGKATQYTIGNCEKCDRLVGISIEQSPSEKTHSQLESSLPA